MLHVPYKGGGPAISDLIAGHVNLSFATILETSGHIKSGRLRALAVTGLARSPALPDVGEALKAPDLRQQFIDQGALPVGGTPAQFQALIDNDRRRYAKIIAEKNISVE